MPQNVVRLRRIANAPFWITVETLDYHDCAGISITEAAGSAFRKQLDESVEHGEDNHMKKVLGLQFENWVNNSLKVKPDADYRYSTFPKEAFAAGVAAGKAQIFEGDEKATAYIRKCLTSNNGLNHRPVKALALTGGLSQPERFRKQVRDMIEVVSPTTELNLEDDLSFSTDMFVYSPECLRTRYLTEFQDFGCCHRT